MLEMSSREFNRDTAGAKRTAASEPVLITDRGEPSLVLLSFTAFTEMTSSGPSLLDVLADDAAAAVELDIARDRSLPRAVDLD
jgi:PHD/YefM family antitoxin component YafN of YafNO toxin-antitoxin module